MEGAAQLGSVAGGRMATFSENSRQRDNVPGTGPFEPAAIQRFGLNIAGAHGPAVSLCAVLNPVSLSECRREIQALAESYSLRVDRRCVVQLGRSLEDWTVVQMVRLECGSKLLPGLLERLICFDERGLPNGSFGHDQGSEQFHELAGRLGSVGIFVDGRREMFLSDLGADESSTNVNLDRLSGVFSDIVASLFLNRPSSDLSFWCLSMGTEGAKLLGRLLEYQLPVKTLNLGWNNLRDEGTEALSLGIARNLFLTAINLESNRIGVNGALALSRALKANRSLETLNLECNHLMGDEGAAALGQALVHSSVMELNVSWCFLNRDSAMALWSLAKAHSKRVIIE